MSSIRAAMCGRWTLVDQTVKRNRRFVAAVTMRMHSGVLLEGGFGDKNRSTRLALGRKCAWLESHEHGDISLHAFGARCSWTSPCENSYTVPVHCPKRITEQVHS